MAPRAQAEQDGIFRQVTQALGKKPLAATFASLLYARKDLDELAGVSAEWLAGNVREALDFIAEKPRGRHKIRLRRQPAGRGIEEGSVIEILNDDMPFLVDSTMGELQARGIHARYLFHPIFKTRRDKSGRLEDILGTGDGSWGDGCQESYIAIHTKLLDDATGSDLVDGLIDILREVRAVVADWRPMLECLRRAIAELEAGPPGVPTDLLAESLAFLKWLEAGNFIFLGARQYALDGDAETGDLVPRGGPGLGVLRDDAVKVLRRGTELVAMTPEVRRFFFAPAPLIVAKANVVARVHRRSHMDYIGIKTYGSGATPTGEIRLVGLFTSQAYVRPPAEIPFLRHKVARVIETSGYPPASHDGKALLNILDTFPRDELFQVSSDELQEWAEGMLELETRPRVRVFARIDRFDRFVSALVYVPRDRYNTQAREEIGDFLSEAYEGTVVAFYPHFAHGPLVRVQFIVARYSGETPQPEIAVLERHIGEIVRTWDDRLADAIAGLGSRAEVLQARYGSAFSSGYAETFTAKRALEDIERIERLGPDRPIAIDFYRETDAPAHRIHAAVYRFGTPISLSERVPVLENMGFSAIDERSYHVLPRFEDGERDVTLHDMVLESADGAPIEIGRHDTRLEECFRAVFRGEADNDGFNRLIVGASADWREVAVLRAYAAYLRQLGTPFGLRYLADTLNRHAALAREFLELFHLRFDPARRLKPAARREAEAPIAARIESALAAVPSLDEDRILRQLLNLVSATVRTNFYQTDASGRPVATLAFKFDGHAVEAAPQPRTFREIWVYAPRVEGVHLRFAPISRGGIRWSDRAQDFRTEVLGLVRAQRVKNAVIVPSGAKGGFLPKWLPRGGTREEVQKEGIAAYRIFISALLDITDNIENGRIVPPRQIVRHDEDDAYLVVAADKGTATFSDIANEISEAHGFWLGDAFASGGSAGYDHKGMGITARGAWECVKRHFREMDIDIQRQPFRVIGVGDMSGDVFGNGMLLSKETRLVAAFDHRDIFIDPEPGPDAWAERKRLFDLPRSSWHDYDKAKISKGGGIFPRSSKSIPLSNEMRALLGIDAASLTPNELMRALLKSKTDLLWFGGIGTYVRASAETDADAGDRTNDPLRVTAADLGARVIGEGANLGMTQRARIEFAACGGRVNTDFIDNSAGVNTSDQEVNIKIALNPAIRAGGLTMAARNKLLGEMTEDVAASSLRNNYQQSLALSLAECRSTRELSSYGLLMRALEARGLLDRPLEALPGDQEIEERIRAGRGLSRPELAVLLSYAKIALQDDLLRSGVPDEPQAQSWLARYFPQALRERFAVDMAQHSLRREIIALGLTNAVVNRGGPPMAVLLADETRRTTPEVVVASLAAREVFELLALWERIDALDGKVTGEAQLALYQVTQDLVIGQTLWFLQNGAALADLVGTIVRHKAGIAALKPALGDVLPPRRRRALDEEATRLSAGGVPPDVARDIAELGILALAPPMTEIGEETGTPVPDVARLYLAIGEHLHLADLGARADAIPTPDYYDRLAVAQARSQLEVAQAAFTRDALRQGAEEAETWLAEQGQRFARVRGTLQEVAGEGTLTVSRLLVAAGQIGDVAAAGPGAPSASPKRGQKSRRSRSAASGIPPARKTARRPRS